MFVFDYVLYSTYYMDAYINLERRRKDIENLTIRRSAHDGHK